MKPGSNLRWRPPRVYTGQDEALKPCRATAVKRANRKNFHREQKRAQLAKFSQILVEMGKMERMESFTEGRRAAARDQRHQPGAMAPRNTTQYLMSNVYDDMTTEDSQAAPFSNETHSDVYVESLSPSSVYTALDSGYESCLAFQQRNFEEAFALCA